MWHKHRSTRRRSAEPPPPAELAINLPEQHFPRRGMKKSLAGERGGGREKEMHSTKQEEEEEEKRDGEAGSQLSILAQHPGSRRGIAQTPSPRSPCGKIGSDL